jgi:hypothetical protein
MVLHCRAVEGCAAGWPRYSQPLKKAVEGGRTQVLIAPTSPSNCFRTSDRSGALDFVAREREGANGSNAPLLYTACFFQSYSCVTEHVPRLDALSTFNSAVAAPSVEVPAQLARYTDSKSFCAYLSTRRREPLAQRRHLHDGSS